ncbi:hypothetical protein EDD22DRAFT_880662, partial [Suillus occidentalis]
PPHRKALKCNNTELQLCLAASPADIPIPKESESKYKFSNFSPDAEWAADIGEAAAINRELEVRLGSRVDDLKLVERGPEMEAIVHVFETWTNKFPGDVFLEKWVDDAIEMYATIHGKPETPPVVPLPTRPPIVTTDSDIISSLTNEHQGRCSDSNDEDGDWPDNGDSTDHTTLYSQQLLVEVCRRQR